MRIDIDVSDAKYRDLQQLMQETGLQTTTDLLNNALTLFQWAVSEAQSGRTVASVDEANNRYKELTMPSLAFAAQRVRAVPAKAATAAF